MTGSADGYTALLAAFSSRNPENFKISSICSVSSRSVCLLVVVAGSSIFSSSVSTNSSAGHWCSASRSSRCSFSSTRRQLARSACASMGQPLMHASSGATRVSGACSITCMSFFSCSLGGARGVTVAPASCIFFSKFPFLDR
uniref:Uncharacterized protein n=1 Tax=Peronospora matthiolae TaxID=2874970 RepID=A0AAV1UU50_9STRA